MGLTNEVMQAFQADYNLGKHFGLMKHCRPEVEKYLFSKVYEKLFAMYAVKHEKEDRLFVERSDKIKRSMRPHEMMSYLGLKEKFLLGDNLPREDISQRVSNVRLESSKYATNQS